MNFNSSSASAVSVSFDKTYSRFVNSSILLKKLGIEVRLEDRETVIYMNGKKLDEKDLQSQKASMAVSKVSNVAKNEQLYEFGKNLIDEYRKDYNIILSSRDIIKMYPDVTKHFFIDASIEERTNKLIELQLAFIKFAISFIFL